MRSLKSGFARAARTASISLSNRPVNSTDGSRSTRWRGFMARQYHGEIRNHLDKNFPYIVVIFDTTGNLAAEIPARNLAEAALDLHARMADFERVVCLSRRTGPEPNGPYAVNRRNFKHEQ